jgi:hypothetical protein
LGTAENRKNLIDQRDLTPAFKTVRDASKRNNSATPPNRDGEIRGICSSLVPLFVDIIPCDDGRYRVGLHDEGPGFESRRFAAAIAAKVVAA